MMNKIPNIKLKIRSRTSDAKKITATEIIKDIVDNDNYTVYTLSENNTGIYTLYPGKRILSTRYQKQIRKFNFEIVNCREFIISNNKPLLNTIAYVDINENRINISKLYYVRIDFKTDINKLTIIYNFPRKITETGKLDIYDKIVDNFNIYCEMEDTRLACGIVIQYKNFEKDTKPTNIFIIPTIDAYLDDEVIPKNQRIQRQLLANIFGTGKLSTDDGIHPYPYNVIDEDLFKTMMDNIKEDNMYYENVLSFEANYKIKYDADKFIQEEEEYYNYLKDDQNNEVDNNGIPIFYTATKDDLKHLSVKVAKQLKEKIIKDKFIIDISKKSPLI